MTRLGFPFALSFVLAFAAAGAEYSDLYIVPAVGHAHGAYGTLWRSDVVLHNIQAVPITVEMALVESGRSPSSTPIAITVGGESSLHLNPGETCVVNDVAGQQGHDITGALIVGADRPFALTSRTYAAQTLGQTILPMAITGSADTNEDVSVLAGLRVGEHDRTNIGAFIAASRTPFVAEIQLLSSSGASLGSRILALDEPGFIHHQLPIAETAASAVVRVLEGDGVVVPYASMIDNVTAEAFSVAGQPVASGGDAVRAMIGRAGRR